MQGESRSRQAYDVRQPEERVEPEKLHRNELTEEARKPEPATTGDPAADRAAAARLSGAQMDSLGSQVDIKQVFLSFGLDQGKVLAKHGDTEFVTKYASRISLVVTPTTIELRCSPYIWL